MPTVVSPGRGEAIGACAVCVGRIVGVGVALSPPPPHAVSTSTAATTTESSAANRLTRELEDRGITIIWVAYHVDSVSHWARTHVPLSEWADACRSRETPVTHPGFHPHLAAQCGAGTAGEFLT